MLLRKFAKYLLLSLATAAHLILPAAGQVSTAAKAQIGSRTAREGFLNETQIRDKFNAWREDLDAQSWLVAMGYRPGEIESLTAAKPHNDKSDVVVTITAGGRTRREGISIKLISSENGFNQIDKRWLSHYRRMWAMPPPVEAALSLFLGERPPDRPSRRADRMFLSELSNEEKESVISFFETNRSRILRDIFAGSGPNKADWLLIAKKSAGEQKSAIFPIEKAMEFFGTGKIEITSAGNLRIGRITVQRKGGDAGRETARMLQFKINPAEILRELKKY